MYVVTYGTYVWEPMLLFESLFSSSVVDLQQTTVQWAKIQKIARYLHNFP